MKRTNKSGHQKRLEAKKKALEQSAACSGQKTLFGMARNIGHARAVNIQT